MAQARVVELTLPRRPEPHQPSYPQTIDGLKRALADSPRDEGLRLRLAHEYQLAAMWAEAANEYSLCLPSRPDDPDLLCDLAACYLRQNALAHAGVLVQQAKVRDAGHRFAGLLEQVLGGAVPDAPKGVEIRVHGSPGAGGLRLTQEQADLLIAEARTLREGGRLEDAAGLLRRTLALSPADAGVAMELGHLHAVEGRWRDAYRWFGEARKREPGNWESRYRMAAAALQLDETEKAASLAKEALAVETGCVPALELLAAIAAEKLKYEEAEFWLGRLLAADPQNLTAQFKAAWLQLRAGKFGEAAAGLRACLDAPGLRCDALYHLGLAQLAMGEAAESIATLSRAWREDGSDDAALALAQAHILARDAGGAEAALSDIIRPDAETAAVWHRLAGLCAELGDTVGAKRAFAEAVRCDGRFAEGYFALQSLL